MDFSQYVKGNTLSLISCDTINISELVSFLQNNPNIRPAAKWYVLISG
ncbi:hypothetical protein ID128_00490 [Candidatus Wolbachia massiliensis]|uniref:Uncharacterized protein n=1 Tax=Candidatus Wolbachia massiliensis TaxID=1845000 RepID=A0A7L7YMC1_9RICK|nr:hypothetical protein ID128_00490 [Candidatus Wolbachia massiliensis]